MKHQSNQIFLEKMDVIRMNLLIRQGTDYEAFSNWYASLDCDEQAELVSRLCEFAYQAGVDDTIQRQASVSSGLVKNSDFLDLLKNVKGPSGLNIGGLANWLRSANAEVRLRAFKYFVYLFGEAERRIFENEDRRSCNHWWHRNLEDPRVVESILKDDQYYRTSPRDDETL
jgi:hypothetical protein